MSRREERAIRDEAEELAAETEAMLSGRLADRWSGDRAPGWVWLNTLAHADWAGLTDIADGSLRGQRSAWDGALMFLAGELLASAGSPGALRDLQRTELVPLELELLAGATPPPATPGGLVSLVRDQLARARSHRSHEM